jgi:hypothetical protein
VLLGAGISSFIFVIISREGKKKKKVEKDVLIEKCHEFVAELLFEESLSESAKKLELFFLQTANRKQILTNELIKLHKSFHGEMAKFIEQYYLEKGLYDLSISKLKSKKKHLVLDGLMELSEMDGENAIPAVKELFLKVKDNELKFFYLEFLIKKEPELGLRQLLKVDLFLCDWFQIKIINILKERNFISVPPLSSWLAKNDTYAIFGCRLTGYSQNHSEIPILMDLLYARNEDLKIAALRSLRILEADDINKELIIKYLDESERVKNEICQTLLGIDQTANTSFFEKVNFSNSEELRHLAFRAIQAINVIKLKRYYIVEKKYSTQNL